MQNVAHIAISRPMELHPSQARFQGAATCTITDDQYEALKAAAKIEGVNVADFMAFSAVVVAKEMIGHSRKRFEREQAAAAARKAAATPENHTDEDADCQCGQCLYARGVTMGAGSIS